MLGLIARMIVAMGVVFAIMYIAARVMRTRVLTLGGTNRANPSIEILHRHSLSRSGSLMIARVGTKYILLGVTDTSITQVSELDIVDLENGLDTDWTTYPGDEIDISPSQTRKGMIEQLRELTARRS